MSDIKINKRGRPRSFTLDYGLDVATSLFVELGYKNVTISMLCDALNVPPTSIYASYKNKSNLYALCLENYFKKYTQYISVNCNKAALLSDYLRYCLESSIEFYINENNSHGCLLLTSEKMLSEQSINDVKLAKYTELAIFFSKHIKHYTYQNETELANLLLTMLAGVSTQVQRGLSYDEIITSVEFFCDSFS
ncbi:TetR/AcrR family transcriptional regulator [Fluctibacter corallii]|uniref:TetR/AcrR family transcriptional regulator n=1 Tax=Fluctibacter corallii TaxID=2984329 RepID=UPI00384E3396